MQMLDKLYRTRKLVYVVVCVLSKLQSLFIKREKYNLFLSFFDWYDPKKETFFWKKKRNLFRRKCPEKMVTKNFPKLKQKSLEENSLIRKLKKSGQKIRFFLLRLLDLKKPGTNIFLTHPIKRKKKCFCLIFFRKLGTPFYIRIHLWPGIWLWKSGIQIFGHFFHPCF